MSKLKDIKQKFEKEGFVVIKNFFSKSEIRHFENTLFAVYSKHLKTNVNKKNIHKIVSEKEMKGYFSLLYKCYNNYKNTIPFKKAAKKLSLFSKKIYEKRFKYLNSGMAIGIKNSKRTAYNWHQEHAYYKNIRNTLHYQFPIITPTSKKNGTMSVLSASHKLGHIKKVKNIKFSNESINTFLPKNIKKIQKKFKEKFIVMKLRDVCLFDEDIIHKTNKNIINQIRFVPIIRLQLS